MSLIYGGCLLLALGAMVLLDRRFRLVFWKSPWRASVAVGGGLVFFLAWDLCGIALGIFARGDSPYMTGIVLAPQLPLEEVFFLTFLCYLTLIIIHGVRAFLDARPPHTREHP